jgi:uncharacterized protein (TIGR03435 family)
MISSSPLFIATLAAAGLLDAQAPSAPTARPEFEVASIKPCKPEGGDRVFSTHYQHNTLTATRASLQVLIEMAYQVKDYQLAGTPGWLNSQRFDIVAKAPPNTPDQFDQLMPMLQALLADRFKLAIHRDTKVVQGYALVVAKSGSKLRESTVAEETGVSKPLFTGSRGNLTAERITMPILADNLARLTDSPVGDATGIQGSYKLHLEWTPDQRQPASTDGPSLFTALEEQLGLKLEGRKVPVELIVIDYIEKTPTEN